MAAIVDVREHYDRDGVDRWQFDVLQDDGTLHGYVMPIHWLPQVAAEYGLPMDDFEQLLDVAIHTAHVDQDLTRGTDPVARARAGRPVTLHNAASLDEVREAHLARIAAVKASGRRIDMPKPGAKARIPVAAAADGRLEYGEVDAHAKLAALKSRFGPDMEIRTGRGTTTVGEWHRQANKDLDERLPYRKRTRGTDQR
ncbi:hypothetical protein [Nonomuraea sp. SYSU D8015]|uniref:hypothetical protein n=1 Tax=Nonomuraea sp. SYSU D8015 TaxID=2593644 RepID=UPI00166029F6|nr:hypothetical protein [Nonomuraea sp. SYSU D8015]